MTGWIALHGGGEFQRGSEIGDRRLVVAAGGADARVIIVPTAAAREYPDMAARHGVQWFKQIGAQADAAMIVDQRSANDSAIVATIEAATLIYLPGGDPVLLVGDVAQLTSLARDREGARARRLDRRGQRRRDGVGQQDVESAHGRSDRRSWPHPDRHAAALWGRADRSGTGAAPTTRSSHAPLRHRRTHVGDLGWIEVERVGTGSGG